MEIKQSKIFNAEIHLLERKMKKQQSLRRHNGRSSPISPSYFAPKNKKYLIFRTQSRHRTHQTETKL